MKSLFAQRFNFALTAVAASVTLATGSANAQSSEGQLLERLNQLAAELDKVKAELQQMKQKQDAAPAPAALLVSGSLAPVASVAQSGTTLSAYGEIGYSRPNKNSSATQTDVGRFVTGFQHRFNERTKVVAELEVEHAVASAGDRGEVAVEQVFVEHRLNQNFGVRAGLFLPRLRRSAR